MKQKPLHFDESILGYDRLHQHLRAGMYDLILNN